MAMNLGTSGKLAPVINVTPLIDVLLVLLIIFMIITPIFPTGENAVIPQPARTDLPEIMHPTVIVLQITPDPQGKPTLRINGQDSNWQDLRQQLATIYKDRRDKSLFVRADETLEWEPVAQAVGIAHIAGVENVGLVTAHIEQARK